MSLSMNIHPSRGESFEPTINVYGFNQGCCLNIFLSDFPGNDFSFHIHAHSNESLNEFILKFKEAASNLQVIEEKEKEEKDGTNS